MESHDTKRYWFIFALGVVASIALGLFLMDDSKDKNDTERATIIFVALVPTIFFLGVDAVWLSSTVIKNTSAQKKIIEELVKCVNELNTSIGKDGAIIKRYPPINATDQKSYLISCEPTDRKDLHFSALSSGEIWSEMHMLLRVNQREKFQDHLLSVSYLDYLISVSKGVTLKKRVSILPDIIRHEFAGKAFAGLSKALDIDSYSYKKSEFHTAINLLASSPIDPWINSIISTGIKNRQGIKDSSPTTAQKKFIKKELHECFDHAKNILKGQPNFYIHDPTASASGAIPANVNGVKTLPPRLPNSETSVQWKLEYVDLTDRGAIAMCTVGTSSSETKNLEYNLEDKQHIAALLVLAFFRLCAVGKMSDSSENTRLMRAGISVKEGNHNQIIEDWRTEAESFLE